MIKLQNAEQPRDASSNYEKEESVVTISQSPLKANEEEDENQPNWSVMVIVGFFLKYKWLSAFQGSNHRLRIFAYALINTVSVTQSIVIMGIFILLTEESLGKGTIGLIALTIFITRFFPRV